jgi:hypothetical protein
MLNLFLKKGGDKSNDYAEDSQNRNFIVTCSCVLDDGIRNLKILNTDEKDRHPYSYKEALSEFLIPYIPTEDLDKRAEEFLKKYYPEALKTPMALPLDDLLRRMNVIAYQAPLKNGVFGKSFFSPSKEKVYNGDNEVVEIDIPKRTILVNPDVCFLRNIGSYNNTIIHECVHLEYHHKFFEIQKMIDDKKKAIACKQGKLPAELNSTYKKAFDLMEWQASSLAPRILMPAKMVYVRFQEEWKTISADYPNALKGRIMELVIERLADFFKVSKQAAKIRLIEIGVDNAAGTSNYINGKYYPSFYFKSHSLEKNQTYVIDFLDAVIQIRTNPKLRELSRQGKLAYANGMVVLNQKKYVSLDENGETVLTEYALEHVDECAFIFSKNPGKSNGVYNSYIESVCFLCRSEDYGEYISSNYDDNDVNRNKISYAQETCDEFIEDSYSLTLLKKMNGSFAEDFMALIKEYVLTQG